MEVLSRRAFLAGSLAASVFALAGCSTAQDGSANQDPQQPQDATEGEEAASSPNSNATTKENAMQIRVSVNGTDFSATVDAGAAGQDLLARLPLTLQMEELHGNEKYCYTGNAFNGDEEVPTTIETGDLMVFSGDCLVLFYDTFANGGWAYQRVGRIDDATGLAEACGSGTATVTFEQVAQ